MGYQRDKQGNKDMQAFIKGTFAVAFGNNNIKEVDGYHTDVFFIYKFAGAWTVCHKQSNLKLSQLGHKLLATSKKRVAAAEGALSWEGKTGVEVAANNGMSGKEFVNKLLEAIA